MSNNAGQAVSSSSSSSGPVSSANCQKGTSEVEQQMLRHKATKPDNCSSDATTDTDSYQTADDSDEPISPALDDAGVNDTQSSTRPVSVVKDPDGDADSSSEEDDKKKVNEDQLRYKARQGETEKRRDSYQFAISEYGRMIPDHDVVCDLDPAEFHHEHVRTDSSDEDSDSHSEDEFCDLDPTEFSHPSTVPTQLTMPLNSVFVLNDGTSTVEHGNGEVFVDDPLQGSSEASGVHSEMCATERHESVIEGNILSTIIIPSPTEKTLDADHREWIMHRSDKRAVLDFSHVLEQLPSLTTVGNDKKLTSHVFTSLLYRDFAEGSKQVRATLSDTNEDRESLPIVEAVVCETTELISAKLIDSAALWKESYMYDVLNLSSSPEKEGHYPFEENVPSPDYDSSTSSSDTSSEAGDDVAVDSDMPACRTERSPTPDYNTLSPIFEQDSEFRFDVGEHSELDLRKVYKATDSSSSKEIRVDDVDDFNASLPLLFERKGSQRFSKPVHRSAVTLKPMPVEQVDEDKIAEYQQKEDYVPVTFEQAKSVELMQKDLCKTQEWPRSGMEAAPVVFASNDKGMPETHIPSTDQPTVYSTLGQITEKKKRTAKRSVAVLRFTVVLMDVLFHTFQVF